MVAQRASLAVRARHAVLLLHQRQPAGGAATDAVDEPLRLGVVASRKVGGAVQRNRAKRLVREWFRHLDVQLPGCDVVVVLRPGAHRLKASQLAAELAEALAQAVARLTRRRQPR